VQIANYLICFSERSNWGQKVRVLQTCFYLNNAPRQIVKRSVLAPTMYMYCIMDPLKGPSLQISSCSSLQRPIGAPNTSSYFMKNVGGKRKSLSFYCQDRPLYIENVALGAMFSLSMLEHVQSIHEHSMYSMISMIGS
jgi:hypothetical protein